MEGSTRQTGQRVRVPLSQAEPHASKLYRQARQTCDENDLIEAGDRILVAISGGKDSYTMLEILDRLVARPDSQAELVAVHLDQVQPGYDNAPLIEWLRERGGRWELLREDTYSVVTEKLEPGATYCSLCSRLRRGILYTAAERLGCNKIALGHHRDDALQTFLLNLFFSGRLQSMPARYRTDCGRFEVIRPLIACSEARIAQYATARRFPILPCNLCGSQTGLQRVEIEKLIQSLEARWPDIRSVMFGALANVRPTHLHDRDLLEAWASRAEHIRPEANNSASRPAHARALPVLSSQE